MLGATTLFLHFLLSTAFAAESVSIPSPSGSYEGQLLRESRFFPYIAYAEPPVGKLRWRRTDLASLVRQRKDPVACAQRGDDTFNGEPLPFQEDCLYLNVWAPLKNASNGNGYPVLLFIHGGGLLSGNGLQKFYDGSVFARKGVVFVSFNYRLAELGYGPKLSKEPGSLGLMDQHNALLWVKKNISLFGGDPSRIFLMGHSKGAEAITALMESGLADDSVKGGIALSFARHFDHASNASIPKRQITFLPGEREAPWPKILEWKKNDLVYIPELPALRLPGKPGPRFQLLTSALYDERFWGNPSEIYCMQAFFLKQFFDYIDPYLFVWHPGAYEHGSELKSLFAEDRFGKRFLDYLVKFLEKGTPPSLGLIKPEPYPVSRQVTHVYPWFALSGTFLDQWKGVECVQPKGYVGSQVNGFFWAVESLLNKLGYGDADRKFE